MVDWFSIDKKKSPAGGACTRFFFSHLISSHLGWPRNFDIGHFLVLCNPAGRRRRRHRSSVERALTAGAVRHHDYDRFLLDVCVRIDGGNDIDLWYWWWPR